MIYFENMENDLHIKECSSSTKKIMCFEMFKGIQKELMDLKRNGHKFKKVFATLKMSVCFKEIIVVPWVQYNVRGFGIHVLDEKSRKKSKRKNQENMTKEKKIKKTKEKSPRVLFF
jgi:hypothetical protein